ncbi:hypothetical protein Tco_0410357 [Tanacetum coccineum]
MLQHRRLNLHLKDRIHMNLLDRVSQLYYPFSLPKHLKADNSETQTGVFGTAGAFGSRVRTTAGAFGDNNPRVLPILLLQQLGFRRCNSRSCYRSISKQKTRKYKLVHIESCKSSTAELFDVDSGRISIVTVNT